MYYKATIFNSRRWFFSRKNALAWARKWSKVYSTPVQVIGLNDAGIQVYSREVIKA